jgi:hypothetical protein
MCQSVSLDTEGIAGEKCNLLIFRVLQQALPLQIMIIEYFRAW